MDGAGVGSVLDVVFVFETGVMRFLLEQRATGSGWQSQKSACLSVRLLRDKSTRTVAQRKGRGPWAVAYPELGLAHVQREGPDGADMRVARPGE
jgi:hypothetical protein